MKRIYESPLNGWDESAEQIYVYALDDVDEFWKLYEMTFEEKCEYFGVVDQTGSFVMPGAQYYTYSFEITRKHIIVTETVSYNV
jgi:hypothetical protein